jgi:nucleoside-diphosphate-sugar epimerase
MRASHADLVTAFGVTDGDPYEATIRIRVDGTRSLVSAARAAGVERFITQSIAFMCTPQGPGLTDEDTPLYLDGPCTQSRRFTAATEATPGERCDGCERRVQFLPH